MVFPSSVCRTAAGYKSVRIRKLLRPTDRPSRHRLVFLVGLCVEAHVEMVPTLQVATACFSGSPQHLSLSKLIPNMSKKEGSSAQMFIYIYKHTHTHTPSTVTLKKPTFCPHSVFVCSVWISEQIAIISLYNIN